MLTTWLAAQPDGEFYPVAKHSWERTDGSASLEKGHGNANGNGMGTDMSEAELCIVRDRRRGGLRILAYYVQADAVLFHAMLGPIRSSHLDSGV
jgi:hypothetical protein